MKRPPKVKSDNEKAHSSNMEEQPETSLEPPRKKRKLSVTSTRPEKSLCDSEYEEKLLQIQDENKKAHTTKVIHHNTIILRLTVTRVCICTCICITVG